MPLIVAPDNKKELNLDFAQRIYLTKDFNSGMLDYMEHININHVLTALGANLGNRNRGRLDAKQTAEILGFQEHDIPVLIKEGELAPLGKPMPNARKYFARVDIMGLADDPKWLSKATNILYEHWQEKNANRKSSEEAESSHSE